MLTIVTLMFSGLVIVFNFLGLPKAHPKRSFIILALCSSAIAFGGQVATSRTSQRMRVAVDSIGIATTQWFQVNDDAGTQKFTISHRPIAGSVDVLLNGLSEPPETYSVQGSDIFVTAMQQRSDSIAIKYRYTSALDSN